MTVNRLLSRLAAKDIQLTIKGGHLAVNAPKGTLSPDLLDEIRVRKNDLLVALQSPPTPQKPNEIRCHPDTLASTEVVAVDHDWETHIEMIGGAEYDVTVAANTDSPGWHECPEAVPCERCGALAAWWDSLNQRHCVECEPPAGASAFRRQVEQLRRRAQWRPEDN